MVDRTMRRRLSRWDMRVSPYLYIAPFFVLFAIFGLYPMGYTLYVATRNWTLGADTSTPAGLANFNELLHDHEFWNSVANTFGIFVLSTIPQLLMALFLAHLLNRVIQGKMLLRFGIIAPIVTSTAVIGLIFSQVFSKDYGMANYLLHLVGVHPSTGKADKWSSWTAVATMVNWRWTGYNALIYLAAMQTIPATSTNPRPWTAPNPSPSSGASPSRCCGPTIIFTAIISTIGGLQLFGEPALFNSGSNYLGGGSLHQFQTMTMYLLQEMSTAPGWATPAPSPGCCSC
jgi:ABC-type sugar transport systems, permease components